MGIRGIAHIAFMVCDMNRSLAFYCDVLGFSRKFQLKDEEGRPWIVYLEIAPGQYLELFYNNGGLQPTERGFSHMGRQIGYMHLCLEATELAELEAQLREKGVEIVIPTRMGSDGSWQMWIEDPDGNPIEFHAYTDKSLQKGGAGSGNQTAD